MSDSTKLSKKVYAQLLLSAIHYRESLAEKVGIKPKHYARVYTSKRKYGLRTKFWYTGLKFKTKKANKYVKKYPTINVAVDGKVYVFEVKADFEIFRNPRYSDIGQFKIYFKLTEAY